jgi:DNA-binding protein YbaB
MDGHKRVQSLRIAPEAVDRDDIDMLQDLIVAAFNDAQSQVEEKLKSGLGGMGGGLPGGFPFGAL